MPLRTYKGTTDYVRLHNGNMIKQSTRKSLKTYGACLVIGPNRPSQLYASFGSGPKSPTKFWQCKCRIQTHRGRDRRQLRDDGIAGRILAWPLGSHEPTCQHPLTVLCFGLSHPKQQYLLNCSFDYKFV